MFMEQVRIVKEMREQDAKSGRTGELIRPRFMVWENVPGAFSSNKGQDFAAVLKEVVGVVEPEAPIVPMPKKGWPTSGCLMGDGWSVAWRVFDAQFWGVPQRRRRIALVADFGGRSAPEILFERKGVHWNSEEGGGEGGCVEPATTAGIDKAGQCFGHETGADRAVCGVDFYNYSITGSASKTLTVSATDSDHIPCILDMTHACDVIREGGDVSPTLQARMGTGGNQVPLVCYQRVTGSLMANTHPGGVTGQDAKNDMLITTGSADANKAVRRLTPLECERLQGLPDNWTDIGEYIDSKGKRKQSVDTVRYKAIGNSIALPSWTWVLQRLCKQIEHTSTMASLFDGIGAFPLIWERINGAGTCLWSSEIEEFPISVTQRRFGENAKLGGQNNAGRKQ